MIYVSIRLSILEVGWNFGCKFQWLHSFGEGEKVYGYTHCAKNSIATRPQVSQNSWDFMIFSFLSQVFQKKKQTRKKTRTKGLICFPRGVQGVFSSKMWTNLYPEWSGEIILFDQHLIFQKLCCWNGTAQVSHYKTWQPQTFCHSLLKCKQVKTTTGFNHPRKKKPKRSIIPGDSSRDLFGMVKTWPFQGVRVTSN